MKMLISMSEFESKFCPKQIPFQCEYCKKVFMVERKLAKQGFIRANERNSNSFCSRKCRSLDQTKHGTINTECAQCKMPIKRNCSVVKNSKTGLFFCSHSCSATYHNAHKVTGIRRSNLEKMLENAIKTQFPDLACIFNDKTVIGSELDVYIPSLDLAFEINGLFHYVPVFGQSKLDRIKKNDDIKISKCKECGIALYVINTSEHRYVNKKTSSKYINYILSVIVRAPILT